MINIIDKCLSISEIIEIKIFTLEKIRIALGFIVFNCKPMLES